MSRCEPFQAQILEGAPGDEALAEHLRSCPGCRGLSASHLAALRLRATAPPRPTRIAQRKVLRRLGAATAVAACLVAAGSLWPAPRRVAPQVVAEQPRADARRFSEADAIWTVFWAQQDAAIAEARQRDPTLVAFGPLGDWGAPTQARRRMTVVWPTTKEE